MNPPGLVRFSEAAAGAQFGRQKKGRRAESDGVPGEASHKIEWDPVVVRSRPKKAESLANSDVGGDAGRRGVALFCL